MAWPFASQFQDIGTTPNSFNKNKDRLWPGPLQANFKTLAPLRIPLINTKIANGRAPGQRPSLLLL